MVKRWHKLGFIERRPIEDGDDVFVETQRNLDDYSKADGTPLVRSHAPGKVGSGIKLPKPDHDGDKTQSPINSLDSLWRHLRTAMAVELSTIPLYLFAMYNVKLPRDKVNDPRYVDIVSTALRGLCHLMQNSFWTLIYDRYIFPI
jgi:hypothetical protein